MLQIVNLADVTASSFADLAVLAQLTIGLVVDLTDDVEHKLGPGDQTERPRQWFSDGGSL